MIPAGGFPNKELQVALMATGVPGARGKAFGCPKRKAQRHSPAAQVP